LVYVPDRCTWRPVPAHAPGELRSHAAEYHRLADAAYTEIAAVRLRQIVDAPDALAALGALRG
jgi:hypothetical protein